MCRVLGYVELRRADTNYIMNYGLCRDMSGLCPGTTIEAAWDWRMLWLCKTFRNYAWQWMRFMPGSCLQGTAASRHARLSSSRTQLLTTLITKRAGTGSYSRSLVHLRG